MSVDEQALKPCIIVHSLHLSANI